MLLKSYGLFWHRDRISWGKPGVSGHLKGYRPNAKKSAPADFREQQGIYVLYDDGFKLLYVGQAGANDKHELFERLKDHRSDALAARWTRFSWFGIRKVLNTGGLAAKADGAHTTNAAVLNHLEAVLIASAEPPLNRQGGRFGGAQQYLQYVDPAVGTDILAMVRDLYDQRNSN